MPKKITGYPVGSIQYNRQQLKITCYKAVTNLTNENLDLELLRRGMSKLACCGNRSKKVKALAAFFENILWRKYLQGMRKRQNPAATPEIQKTIDCFIEQNQRAINVC